MRHIVRTAAVALLVFSSRSAAQTSYLLDSFTFEPRTRLLVGTVGPCMADLCHTVYLAATESTAFLPQDRLFPPTIASDPLYGLFTAWNALTSSGTVQWTRTREASYSLLVAMSLNDARSIATTLDGVSLLSVQPVGTSQCTDASDCPASQVCVTGLCAYEQCTPNVGCPGALEVCKDGFCVPAGGGVGEGCSGACD